MESVMAEIDEKIGVRIITITLNPVFDKTLWIENFNVGKTFPVQRSETYAGGKGVNVSRALLNFGTRTTATGIIGNNGQESYFNLLDADGIDHDFYITGGTVRTNITIVSPETGTETHLREKGPLIHESALIEFSEKLLGLKVKYNNPANVKSDKDNTAFALVLFVFAGSLPNGLSKHTYRNLIETVKGWNCTAILDASGEAFKEGISAAPHFIKPNVNEVEDALGFLPLSNMDFIKAVETFHSMGVERVMISRGKDGILFSSGNGILEAKLYIEHPINTVGSGDCAVAGGVVGIIQNLNDEDTARLACAMGGANTLISGAGRFSKEKARELLACVKLNYLKTR